MIKAYWSQNYAIIYQCNEVVDAIETGHLTEENDLYNKGEALFFRAYCYFNLVRAFGEVPLVTFKVNEASEANVPKTTVDKIYEQIDKGLERCGRFASRTVAGCLFGTSDVGSCPFPACPYLYDAQ